MTHGNIRDPLKIKSLKAIGKNQAFYRASLTTDGEVVGIDRLDYSELEKSAQALSPTTFAMEPYTEMNYLGKFCKIRNYSHSPIGDLIFEESGRNFPSGRN